MSTVLWANRLLDGVVTSDQSDKCAMYRHLKKLDKLSEKSGVPAISSFCDSTDVQCNLDMLELPGNMDSTDALMAVQGVWIDAVEAARVLDALMHVIREEGTRFGLFQNDHDLILSELEESYEFAKAASESNGQFNFSVVM